MGTIRYLLHSMAPLTLVANKTSFQNSYIAVQKESKTNLQLIYNFSHKYKPYLKHKLKKKVNYRMKASKENTLEAVVTSIASGLSLLQNDHQPCEMVSYHDHDSLPD